LSLFLDLSPSQLAKLGRYEEMLRSRGIEMGLIATGDLSRIAERHIQDSLRAAACIRGLDRRIVDLGSGAGLPGVPLAICFPDRDFVLVEAQRKRAAFLEFVVDALPLANASVAFGRAEKLDLEADSMDGQLCVARAFAPPDRAWRVTEQLLGPTGRLLYFAGATWDRNETVDALRAEGIAVEICVPKQFTWQGPLVIMERYRPSAVDGSRHHGSKQR
jgi:16S rRNA (guanine527-N7)-methyltransferase